MSSSNRRYTAAQQQILLSAFDNATAGNRYKAIKEEAKLREWPKPSDSTIRVWLSNRRNGILIQDENTPDAIQQDELTPEQQLSDDITKHERQDELRRLRSAYRQLVKNESIVQRVSAQVMSEVKAWPSVAPGVYAGEPDDGFFTEQDAVIVNSCLHFGEVVSHSQTMGLGGYDPYMAAARYQYFVDAVINILKRHHAGVPIKRLWVVNVGDNTSGNIHKELQVTNAFPLGSQFVRAAYLLASGLRDFAANFEEVKFIGTVGNHTRFEQKPQNKEKFDSGDWIIYQIMKSLLAEQKNVEFNIPDSPWATQNILGHEFFFTHGDSIRAWMGFPWYDAKRYVTEMTSLLIANGQPAPKYFCALPGQQIWLPNGSTQEVSTIRERDMAWNQNGEVRVVGASEIPYSGTAFSVHVDGLPDEIQLTSGHKVLVREDLRFPCEQLKGDTPQWTEPQWVSVDELRKGTWVGLPIPEHANDDESISDDMLTLLGWYLAEGHATDRQVTFAFHEDEVEYQSEVSAIGTELFGAKARIEKRPSRCVPIRFCSKDMADKLHELGGHLSYGKRIHDSVMNLPAHRQLKVLLSYLKGDAFIGDSTSSNSTSVSTKSEVLARQIFLISLRNGLQCSLSKRSRVGRDGYVYEIHYSKSASSEIRELTGHGSTFGVSKNRRNQIHDNTLWMKVKSIEAFDYTGNVYDFAVSSGESYVVSGMIAHNCMGQFHQSNTTQLAGGEMMFTGSLKGADEFVINRLRAGGSPVQLMFGVHPTHGVSFRYPIYLDTADPVVHSRYLMVANPSWQP